MDGHLQMALDEARAAAKEGGFPVGAVIVLDGTVLGRGRNRFAQTGDATTHAELEAIRDALATSDEARAADSLEGATCVTTMMPCEMCAGAIIRFGISRVVVAEVSSYVDAGTAPLLERQGITVEVLDDAQCRSLVEAYLDAHPEAARRMRGERRKLRL